MSTSAGLTECKAAGRRGQALIAEKASLDIQKGLEQKGGVI